MFLLVIASARPFYSPCLLILLVMGSPTSVVLLCALGCVDYDVTQSFVGLYASAVG